MHARYVLQMTALALAIFSVRFWFSIQTALVGDVLLALIWSLLIALIPPALLSLLVPWSPLGTLLLKASWRSWGYGVVALAWLISSIYVGVLMYTWWAAQGNAHQTAAMQTVIGFIGLVVLPALALSASVPADATAKIVQARLVQRYELQTQADIAVLRATLLRAESLALRGWANLDTSERSEFLDTMAGILIEMDGTAAEAVQSAAAISGTRLTTAVPRLLECREIQDAFAEVERQMERDTAFRHRPR